MKLLLFELSDLELVVCAVYISPTVSIDYHKDLYDYLHSLCDTRKVVILGDFNAPDIDWLTFSSETAKSELLCDFLFDNNLLQLIQEPTHALGNILDLVITNTDSTTLPTTKVHAIDHFKLQSDNCIITFSLAVPLPSHHKKLSVTIYNYQKADWDYLNLFFSQALFSQSIVFYDVETCWKYLKSLIAKGLELFVPKIQTHATQHPRWFTSML